MWLGRTVQCGETRLIHSVHQTPVFQGGGLAHETKHDLYVHCGNKYDLPYQKVVKSQLMLLQSQVPRKLAATKIGLIRTSYKLVRKGQAR